MKHLWMFAVCLLFSSGCVRQQSAMRDVVRALEPLAEPKVTIWDRPYEGMRETGAKPDLLPMQSRKAKPGGNFGIVELAWADIDGFVSENDVVVIQRKRLDNGNCGLAVWFNP